MFRKALPNNGLQAYIHTITIYKPKQHKMLCRSAAALPGRVIGFLVVIHLSL